MIFDPLNLDDVVAYKQWRDKKISFYQDDAHLSIVGIKGDCASADELEKIQLACERHNYSIYRLDNPISGTKHFVHELGLLLGLKRLDGNLCSDDDNITSIQVKTRGRRSGYIPYTDKPLTWHSDGYYNKEHETIRAMTLHCVRPALEGGDNLMLDHEMAYIQLREENPNYILAFSKDDALTIPPNIENGIEVRGAQSGPVFSMDKLSSHLHMRFSARTRNIQWKDDALTQEAVECMKGLLNVNNPYVNTHRLKAGEGIIANNILHNRTAFRDSEFDDEKRLLYRARYYDRVNEL